MRKPRDFDSELKALTDKVRLLKERKIRQLGELVIATGADALEPETLSGALLAIVEVKDVAKKEAWRNRGRAFFRGRSRGKGGERDGDKVSKPGAVQQPEARDAETRATDRGAQPNAADDQQGQSHDAPR
jgi:hypothetical protein